MPEPTQTVTAPTDSAATPPAVPDTAPEIVTFTKQELEQARKVWEAEAKKVAIQERFKNSPTPEEIKALQRERDELLKAVKAKQDSEKTEVDKLREARDAALLSAETAKREAEKQIADTTARYDAERKVTEILRAVSELKTEGVFAAGVSAEHVATLTAGSISVIEGKMLGKDSYERPCSVKDYLKLWAAQPSQLYFRPPAPAGTGTEPGRAPGDADKEPPRTASEAWSRVMPSVGRGRKHKPPTGTQYAEAASVPPDKG